jgi:hypothetical protein
MIETFSTQWCTSKDANKRKGGLIAIGMKTFKIKITQKMMIHVDLS